MTRAVIDTNVLLSGVLGYARPTSTPGEILRRWRQDAFTLILSPALLLELEDTLARPYFVEQLTAEQRRRALASFGAYAELVDLTVDVRGAAPDPDDDHVLAAAVSSQAEYLVTGDRGLVGLGSYEDIAIITPRAFLDLLEAEGGEDA